MKKNKIKFIVIIIILFFIVCLFYLISINKNYDINKSPITYNITSYKMKISYFKYLLKYIKPIKLQNYIPYERVPLYNTFNENSTGYDVIEVLKYYGYTEIFNIFFNSNALDLSFYPVTQKFSKKFGSSVLSYFNLIKANDNEFICGVTIDEKKLVVTEMKEIIFDEPTYVYYHHYKYTLDEYGNIDDIKYEYTD